MYEVGDDMPNVSQKSGETKLCFGCGDECDGVRNEWGCGGTSTKGLIDNKQSLLLPIVIAHCYCPLLLAHCYFMLCRINPSTCCDVVAHCHCPLLLPLSLPIVTCQLLLLLPCCVESIQALVAMSLPIVIAHCHCPLPLSCSHLLLSVDSCNMLHSSGASGARVAQVDNR